ncbi:MAG: GNAT family N-acetyltransferase [Christensenellaceae bacterium]
MNQYRMESWYKMMISCTKITRQDIGMLSEWLSHADARDFLVSDATMSLSQQFKWFEHMKNDSYATHWIIHIDGKPCGMLAMIDINIQNNRCSWGYYMHDYALNTEELAMVLEYNVYEYAFEELGFNKLTSASFTDNQCAVDIHAKCGCVTQGILLEHYLCGDVYYDIVLQCMTAKMWRTRKAFMDFERIELK